MGQKKRKLKQMKFILALVFIASVFAVETNVLTEEPAFIQEEMKAEPEMPAQPNQFLPAMMMMGQQSPFYSMFFNPYSYVGLFNPQQDMMPHTMAVMKAFHGDQQGAAPFAHPYAGMMGMGMG